MKPYAFYRESETVVDWSRVCADCERFPNRCDHVGVRQLFLVVVDRWSLEALVARMKEQITADIEAGVVPADVADFAALHDHVDANCYGDLCDDDCPLISEAGMAIINHAQAEVDRWLKGGR